MPNKRTTKLKKEKKAKARKQKAANFRARQAEAKAADGDDAQADAAGKSIPVHERKGFQSGGKGGSSRSAGPTSKVHRTQGK